ncbi:MAG: tyrosine-protein phosphatase [Ilumatobacteraceae bacterium]
MPSVVTDVSVERSDDGRLVIGWALTGPDVGVDVAMGSRPDLIDHGHAVTVAAGERSVHVAHPPGARAYVSVSPSDGGSGLVGAERRVVLEGAVNFRDLGGYVTADGRRTRWGSVFRSDAFHALTDEDRRRFGELGLRVLYDLRSDSERASHPNLVPEDDALRSVELFLSSGEDATGALPPLDQLLEGSGFLLRLYRGMVSNGAPVFGTLLSGLAEPDALPAVFHCLWGKDRTGVAAALLLSALGVPQAAVVADYELTEQFRSREDVSTALARLEAAGVPPEAALGVASTPGWVIDLVLTEIGDQYGGIDGYLLGPAGMTPRSLDDLRRLLLTD